MSVRSEAHHEIVVRQARHPDLDAVGDFFLGLSHRSRYHRFLSGIRYLSPEQKRHLVTVSARQVVLLALDGPTVVGHIMAVFEDDVTVDVGLVVADAYQRRGVGTRMVDELVTTLAASGVRDACLHVQAQNHVVMVWAQRLLTNLRFERSRESLTVRGRFLPRLRGG